MDASGNPLCSQILPGGLAAFLTDNPICRLEPVE
jgi:hypothetical protein